MTTLVAPSTELNLPSKRRWYQSRTNQVFLAMVLGVALGHFWPSVGVEFKPLADIFVRLVKMVVGPIVFITVVCGIAQAGDLKKAGLIGLKALIYFEVVTTVALGLGLLVGNVVKPGLGIAAATLPHPPVAGLPAAKAAAGTWVDSLVSVFPDNAFGAFATGNLMQILVFAILMGAAMSLLRTRMEPVLDVFERLGVALFGVIGVVMRLAPLAAFGAMAFAVGKFGAGTLIPLFKLVGTMFLTMAFFVFVVLGAVARYCHFSLWKLLRYCKSELALVLGTSSSETVLPSLMKKLQELGCDKSVVGLVMPTGYSFNQDGAAIYLSMCVLFIAQVYGVDLSLTQQLGCLAVLMVTSKGSAGVTGSSFVILAATVASTNIVPMEGVALLLGVERFLSIGRALLTVIGNLVATMVISRWVGEFDKTTTLAAYQRAFDKPNLTRI